MTAEEEIVSLAIEIADSTAMSDLECFCSSVEISNGDIEGMRGWWWNISSGDGEFTRGCIDRAVRYLELKGLTERCPGMPYLVRKVTK